MRFSSLFLALPLVGSVLGAPLAKPAAPAVYDHAIAARDIDVLAVVNGLKAKVEAAVGDLDLTVKADVQSGLSVIVSAFNETIVALAVDPKVQAAVNVKRDDLTETVAHVLSDVLVDVNDLVGELTQDLLADDDIKALLATLTPLVGTVLNAVEALLAGVLALVNGILSDLGINLSPVLGLVNNLLGGLLGGIL